MDRVIGRDPQALEQLTQRLACVARILAYRNHRLGRPLDDDELRDVAQDTCVAALRRLPDYEPLAPLESWLFGICELQLRDAVRRKARLRQRAGPLGELDVAATEAAPEHRVLDSAEVERLLVGLGGIEARILRLKHLEGRTFTEIAALLELSPNTAKTLHYRALARLRHLLDAERTRRETT